jgi:hypothetical protein
LDKKNITEKPDLPQSYLDLIKKHSAPKKDEVTGKLVHTPITIQFEKGTMDNSLYHVALSLIKGGMATGNVLETMRRLCLSLPTVSKKDVEEKIISAINRTDRINRNYTEETREWVSATFGYFSVTELYNALHIVTKEEKGRTRTILHRLVEEEIIERHQTKNACYRKVNKELIKINWLNETEREVALKWPLDIQQYFITMPKNIIVVAGSPDSGKTAFLLNFIANNMNSHEIIYFSSEMGAMELKSRLSKFEGIDSWRFDSYERSGQFADEYNRLHGDQ